jgi:uncharacterized protein DUF1569
MKSLEQDAVRKELIARVDSITDGTKPRWGNFTSRAMLDHLARSAEMAAGERAVASKKLPIRYFPLKQLIIYLVPFPKGAPTAPELLNDSPEPIDKSKATLRRIISAFDPKPGEHPAFGKMSPHAWSVLVYRHMDHHLRQFGA